MTKGCGVGTDGQRHTSQVSTNGVFLVTFEQMRHMRRSMLARVSPMSDMGSSSATGERENAERRANLKLARMT